LYFYKSTNDVKMTWICPTCRREFRNTNQDHSCLITNLESHFVNKQQNVIDTFTMIKDVVMKLKGVKIISVKNAILFQARSNFLAVKPRKAHLDIEFLLNERVEGFPVNKTVQATKHKVAHFVRLESPEEADEQLILWLKKAYKISSE
jgi:hypothetical protein